MNKTMYTDDPVYRKVEIVGCISNSYDAKALLSGPYQLKPLYEMTPQHGHSSDDLADWCEYFLRLSPDSVDYIKSLGCVSCPERRGESVETVIGLRPPFYTVKTWVFVKQGRMTCYLAKGEFLAVLRGRGRAHHTGTGEWWAREYNKGCATSEKANTEAAEVKRLADHAASHLPNGCMAIHNRAGDGYSIAIINGPIFMNTPETMAQGVAMAAKATKGVVGMELYSHQRAYILSLMGFNGE